MCPRFGWCGIVKIVSRECLENGVRGSQGAYVQQFSKLGAGKRGVVARSWEPERVFEPQMSEERRQELYRGWQAAVRAACVRPEEPQDVRMRDPHLLNVDLEEEPRR